MSMDSDKGLPGKKATTSTPTHSFAPSLPSELSSIYSSKLDETAAQDNRPTTATTVAAKRKKGPQFTNYPPTTVKKSKQLKTSGSSGNVTIRQEKSIQDQEVFHNLYIQYLYSMVLKTRQEEATNTRIEATLVNVWKMVAEREKLADEHNNLQIKLQLLKAIKQYSPVLEHQALPALEDIVSRLDDISLEQYSKGAEIQNNLLPTKDIVLPSNPGQVFQSTAAVLQEIQGRPELSQLSEGVGQLLENEQFLQDSVQDTELTVRKLTSQAVIHASRKTADLVKGQAKPPDIDAM